MKRKNNLKCFYIFPLRPVPLWKKFCWKSIFLEKHNNLQWNFQESEKTQNSFVSKEDCFLSAKDKVLLLLPVCQVGDPDDTQDFRLFGQPFSNKQGAKISAI